MDKSTFILVGWFNDFVKTNYNLLKDIQLNQTNR